MSKLNDMIKRLCPDGVEFVKLGGVIKSINTGLNPRRFFSLNTPDATNFYVTIREMRNGKIVFNNDTDKINDAALKLCNNRSNLEKGDVIFSGTGTIGQIVVLEESPNNWNIKEGLYALKPIQERIISKYLAYVLRASHIRKLFMKKALGGTVKSVPMKVLTNIEIPLPPLPIQAEIVRILDNFTQLEAELEAELDCRKRQYEFYRDQLLSFDKLTPPERNNVVWKKLSEVGTFVRGNGLQKKDFTAEGVGCIHYGQIYTHYKTSATKTITYCSEELAKKLRKAEYGDVVIATTSENVEDVCKAVAWMGKESVAVSGDAYIYKHNQNPKYIAYIFQTANFFDYKKRKANGTKVIRLSGDAIGKYEVPLPPMEEQNRIVAILDRFEALTTSLQHGLPAEIAARRQQYEYYRDKLLDFKRKTA